MLHFHCLPSPLFNKKPEIGNPKTVNRIEKIEPFTKMIVQADGKAAGRKMDREVKRILKGSSAEEVIGFLQNLTKKGREELVDRFLDEELLKKVLKVQGLTLEDVKAQMAVEAKRPSVNPADYETSLIGSTTFHLTGFINFLPKLIITFLERLGDDKVPSTAWESYIMLEIYFRFLILPYLAFSILLTLSVPALTALIATSAATVITGAAAYLYVRFFNVPKHLENAENIAEKAKQGKLPAYYGNEEVLQKMLQCRSQTGKHLPVLLIGEPGVGKTATAQEFIKKLIRFEPKVQMHDVDPNELVKMNIEGEKGAKFDLKLKRVAGYERTQVFFLDELHKIDDLEKLGKTFDTSEVMIIAATTLAGYQKIKENKEAFQAFRERVQIIKLKTLDPTNVEEKAQLIEQVRTRIHPLTKGISVDEDVFKHAVEQCAEKLQGHIQPRIAINILREAVNYVRQKSNPDHFKSTELIKGEKNLEISYGEYTRKRRSGRWLESMQQAKIVRALENEVEKLRGESKAVRRKIHEIALLKKRAKRLSYDQWTRAKKGKDQQQYAKIHLFVLPALRKKIFELENALIEKEIPVRLDASIIDRIIEEKVTEYKEERDSDAT